MRRCEDCNVGADINHARSLSHRKIKRFKRLLAQNCVSLSEIGVRLGFTRERARQLAARFGVTGTDRRQVCSVNRREKQRLAAIQSSVYVRAILEQQEKQGWDIEIVDAKSAIINGKIVRFGKLRYESSYNRAGFSGIVNRGADFVVYYREGTWLILPSVRNPKSSATTFALHEPATNRGMGAGKRHDWRQYINAFHLLDAAADLD